MAKTLEDAAKRIQYHAGTLDGVRQAPSYPPDGAPAGPFAVAAPMRGEWGRQADWKKGLHTIVCLILVPLKDTARDVQVLLPYGESFPDAIWGDPTLNSTVDSVNALRWTFGQHDYAGLPHLGWRFEIDIKQETAIT